MQKSKPIKSGKSLKFMKRLIQKTNQTYTCCALALAVTACCHCKRVHALKTGHVCAYWCSETK